MPSIYNLYEEVISDLESTLSMKWDDVFGKYREVYPKITKDDYYIATIADFKNVTGKIEWADLKAKQIESPSSHSLYKIVNGYLYRRSDHWGNVASCIWELDYAGVGGYQIGMVKLSEMKPNVNSNKYIVPKLGAENVLKDAITTLTPYMNGIKYIKNKTQIKQVIEKLKNWMKQVIELNDMLKN